MKTLRKVLPLFLALMIFATSTVPAFAMEPIEGYGNLKFDANQITNYLNENLKEIVEENEEKPEDEKLTDNQLLLKLVDELFYTEIPLMFQTDYPDVPYSQGSVATSGCGISCLAMIATYLLDTEYTPGELGAAYNKKASDNTARMEYGIADLGLEAEKTHDWNRLIEALEEGHPTIALVGSDSTFTSVGHFLIYYGLTEDGKILVKDPNGWNYQREELKNGYENGFPQTTCRRGFFTAWIFPCKEPYTIEMVATALNEKLSTVMSFGIFGPKSWQKNSTGIASTIISEN